jgi:nitrogen fixation/metabolism regulation signal transduction histidine kinase
LHGNDTFTYYCRNNEWKHDTDSQLNWVYFVHVSHYDSQFPMEFAPAKQLDAKALEDLGRATLRIVHDLKNQLNGLKLYATYLRKRLDRDENATTERETVEKLVAGLDHAAKEMSALVRYAQPLDVRRQPKTDLQAIVHSAVHDPTYRVSGPLIAAPGLENREKLIGAFDAHAMAEAFSALTREALARRAGDATVTLKLSRVLNDGLPLALVEWGGLAPQTSAMSPGIHAAVGKRIIEAHGGVVEFDHQAIKVKLPLSE